MKVIKRLRLKNLNRSLFRTTAYETVVLGLIPGPVDIFYPYLLVKSEIAIYQSIDGNEESAEL